MKFWFAFLYLSIVFLLVYSPAQAQTESSHHHHDRETTRLPYYSSTSYEEGSTKCDIMGTSPSYVVATVGQNVTFLCTCESKSNHIHWDSCPEWKQIDNVLHMHSRSMSGNTCVATLQFPSVDLNTPTYLTCFAQNMNQMTSANLVVRESSFEEYCKDDVDCVDLYRCKESKCDCPDDKPLHIPTSYEKCHSVRRLLHSCWSSAQCQGANKNSFCSRESPNSTLEDGICICKDGYENENGRCVCSDSVYQYVYGFSKRYRTIFYILLASCCALIIVGLVRIYVIYRRGPTRRLGCVVSTNAADGQPIVTNENEKQ